MGGERGGEGGGVKGGLWFRFGVVFWVDRVVGRGRIVRGEHRRVDGCGPVRRERAVEGCRGSGAYGRGV